MPKEVTKYQTPDGRVFDTEQQAQRHEEDALCERLDKFFIHWLGDSPRHEIYKAVCAASSNKPLLKEQLLGILKFIEEDS